jgi:protein O-GlcNAc transferase
MHRSAFLSSVIEDNLKKAAFLAAQGASAQARQFFSAVLAAEPDNEAAQAGLAALQARSSAFNDLSALFQAGEFARVIEDGEALAARYPDQAFLFNLLGGAEAGLRNWDAAIAAYDRAVRLRPDMAQAHVNLGKSLSEAGRPETAMGAFRNALKLNPDHADAHYSLGIVLMEEGRLAEAVSHLARAAALEPKAADMHSRLGAALAEAGRHEDAIVCFRRALAIHPAQVNALIHLSIAFNALGRLDEEIAVLDEILAIDPSLADVRGRKLFLQATICDWSLREADKALYPTLGVEGVALQPFTMLPLEDHPARHRARSELFVTQRLGQIAQTPITPPAARPKRLKIGYFSADFRGHAVMMQLIRVLELHDRAEFEIFAYSYGAPVQDAMRLRAQRAVTLFRDMHGLSAKAIGEQARRDGLDIAVDLMGHTRKTKLEIFAHRAAPVQINWLGFPGSIGADFMDYMIADKVIIPGEQRAHYREKILYLPASHMPADDSRRIAPPRMTRVEAGLPEKGFVFCCFNNSFKISPADFDIWMRLLDQVEGSVLWLVESNSRVWVNLRREAAARGVDPARLIPAKRVTLDDHLARHGLADLFLDTCPYTGHATAADALQAGLPLVTRPGKGYASRVGAGLLTAIGLPELIAASAEDYERIALALARDAEMLADLKAKLAALNKSSPLFDSADFTRHVEAAYRKAYDRFFDGKAPEDILAAG